MAMLALQDDKERQLYETVSAKYGTLILDFAEDERFIRGEYGENVLPKEWIEKHGLKEPIKFPTINDAIDNATDHILTTPRITVPIRPSEIDKDHQRQLAEDKRWFLDMFFDQIFQNQGDPLGRVTRSLIKGKGVLKKEIDWSIIPKLPDNPTKKQKDKYRRDLVKAAKSRFLWKVTVIPKSTVFEDIERPWDPAYVFEAFDITIQEALHRFPELKADLDVGDPLETVEYIEYWSKPRGSDPGKYIRWVDLGNDKGTRHEKQNPYSWKTNLSTDDVPDYTGYVPYAIGDPGWGDVEADSDPFDRYVSLTRYMRSPVEAETRQATTVEMALRMGVFKVLRTVNMGDVADGTRKLEIGPGKVWDLTDDQTAEYVEYGEPVTLSQFQWLSRLQEVNDRHSKFGALGGSPQRGVDTATEADQNSRNAATKLSGPINALRRMVMTLSAWALMDIPFVFEAPVTIFGGVQNGPSEVTLRPRDLKQDSFLVNVQMETSDEAALKTRDVRTWIDAAQAAPISWDTALRNAGINDPQGEMRERMLEDLLRSESVNQVLLQVILAAQESNEATNALLALQQSMIDGGQGGGSSNGRSPNQTNREPGNAIEALRAGTRDAAIQNQPERSFF